MPDRLRRDVMYAYILLQNLALLYLYCDTILLSYRCHACRYTQRCSLDNCAEDRQNRRLGRMQTVQLSFQGNRCQIASGEQFLSEIQDLLQ